MAQKPPPMKHANSAPAKPVVVSKALPCLVLGCTSSRTKGVYCERDFAAAVRLNTPPPKGTPPVKYDESCDLLDVIIHPLGLDHFLKFVKKDFSDENLKTYKSLDSSRQLSKSKQILEDYLRPGAAQQVSLDSNSLDRMARVIKEGVIHNITAALQRAQSEVLALMRTDSFRRFKLTENWPAFQKEVGQFNKDFPQLIPPLSSVWLAQSKATEAPSGFAASTASAATAVPSSPHAQTQPPPKEKSKSSGSSGHKLACAVADCHLPRFKNKYCAMHANQFGAQTSKPASSQPNNAAAAQKPSTQASSPKVMTDTEWREPATRPTAPSAAVDLLADLGLGEDAHPPASGGADGGGGGVVPANEKKQRDDKSGKHRSNQPHDKRSKERNISSGVPAHHASTATTRPPAATIISSAALGTTPAASRAVDLLADLGLDDADVGTGGKDLLAAAGLSGGDADTDASKPKEKKLALNQGSSVLGINILDENAPAVKCVHSGAKCCRHRHLECLAGGCRHGPQYQFCCVKRKTLHPELEKYLAEQEEVKKQIAEAETKKKAELKKNHARHASTRIMTTGAPNLNRPATVTGAVAVAVGGTAAARPSAINTAKDAKAPQLGAARPVEPQSPASPLVQPNSPQQTNAQNAATADTKAAAPKVNPRNVRDDSDRPKGEKDGGGKDGDANERSGGGRRDTLTDEKDGKKREDSQASSKNSQGSGKSANSIPSLSLSEPPNPAAIGLGAALMELGIEAAQKDERAARKAKEQAKLAQAEALENEMLDVLRHPLGLEYFIRCLHAEKLGEENIKFWVKINELKALTDRAKHMEKSAAIYDQFVRAGAPDQVSIDAQVVIRLSGALEKHQYGSILLSMARAQQKIEIILRGDSFKRFKRSKLLAEYTAALADFNARNPDRVPLSYAKVKENAILHPPVVYNKHTDISDVLNHPLGTEYYAHFLAAENKQGYINFWADVRDFMRLPTAEQAARSKDIFGLYLEKDAQQPIELDAKTVEAIRKLMLVANEQKSSAASSTATANTVELLVEAMLRGQREALGVLKADMFRRFKASDLWSNKFVKEAHYLNRRFPELILALTSAEANAGRNKDGDDDESARNKAAIPVVEYDKDTDILDVINHPLGLKYFTKFLAAEHNDEFIIFYERIKEYRKYDPYPTKQIELAKSIHNEFIRDTASAQVPLDAATLQLVNRAVDAGDLGFLSIAFTRAQKEIVGLMRSDMFRRFMVHPNWNDFCRDAKEFNRKFPELVPPKAKDQAAKEAEVKKAQPQKDTPAIEYNEDTELLDVINHPLGIEFFSRFLVSDFNEANLKFWAEVNTYKKTDPAKQRDKVSDILYEFIRKGCPSPVKVSTETADALCKSIDKQKKPEVVHQFMLKAQTEVVEFMRMSVFPRFLKHPLWNEFCRDAVTFNHRFPELVPDPTPRLPTLKNASKRPAAAPTTGTTAAVTSPNTATTTTASTTVDTKTTSAATNAAALTRAPSTAPTAATVTVTVAPNPSSPVAAAVNVNLRVEINAGGGPAIVTASTPQPATVTVQSGGAVSPRTAAATTTTTATGTTAAVTASTPSSSGALSPRGGGGVGGASGGLSPRGGPSQYGICATLDCGKPAAVGPCPICVQMKLPPAYFCTQDCFTTYWAEHCKTHEKPVVSCNHTDGAVCCRHREKACLSGQCSHSCCSRRASLHRELVQRYSGVMTRAPLSTLTTIAEPNNNTAAASSSTAATATTTTTTAATTATAPVKTAEPTAPKASTPRPTTDTPSSPVGASTTSAAPAAAAPPNTVTVSVGGEDAAKIEAELKAKNDYIAALERRLKAMSQSVPSPPTTAAVTTTTTTPPASGVTSPTPLITSPLTPPTDVSAVTPPNVVTTNSADEPEPPPPAETPRAADAPSSDTTTTAAVNDSAVPTASAAVTSADPPAPSVDADAPPPPESS